jgi:hypothetical protein
VPGEYGHGTLAPNSTIFLSAGDYQFESLLVEPGSQLVVDDEGDVVRIFIRAGLTFRGSIVPAVGDKPRVQVLVEGGGTLPIESAFDGVLIAPSAKVVLSSNVHSGVFAAKELEVQAHAQVYYEPAGLGWGQRELSVFGASTLPPPAPTPTLGAELTYNADWGSGFCKNIEVTNSGTAATSSWSVTLGGSGYSVYSPWNASWTGSPSAPTFAPNQPWNQIILPGESDGTVGFCAYRTSPGATPVVVSVEAVQVSM